MRTREIINQYGRIWYGDLPDRFYYPPTTYAERIFDGFPVAHTGDWRSVCVLFKYNGEHAQSGVLGCYFTPNTTEQLTLRIGISPRNGTHHNSVTPGLPEHLAACVLEEAENILPYVNFLPGGTLEYTHAAWHEVESSSFAFHLLARSTLMLLDPQLDNLSSENASRLISGNIQLVSRQMG